MATMNSDKPGATGKFPEGRLNPHDEGELKIAVGHDKAKGKVIIQFGKEISWIAMNATQAINLGRGIVKHGKKLLKGKRD